MRCNNETLLLGAHLAGGLGCLQFFSLWDPTMDKCPPLLHQTLEPWTLKTNFAALGLLKSAYYYKI